MDKFFATFSLTYKSKVKAKSFIIFTSIVIVLMLAAANINKILDMFDDGPDKVGVVTKENQVFKMIQAQGDTLDEGAKFKKVSESEAKRSEERRVGKESSELE